ncbi:MAG: hypothetical protein O9274_15955, partial [Limnobacter sp.]|uniref:hypothetical protein n=1 Tax=Limnobacter sp. TaxID=2003368 RepID=UPI0022C0DF6D
QKNHVQFFTAVCYDWLRLLDSDEAKLIVIESLKFRIAQGQVKVGAYVIMPLVVVGQKVIFSRSCWSPDQPSYCWSEVILGCCCGSPDR